MRVKILILMFCAFLFSFLIFNHYKSNKLYVLSLGDSLSLGTTPFKSYDKGYNDLLKSYLEDNDNLREYNDYFLSEGETYSSIIHKFDEDYQVSVKGRNVSLRSSIAKADVILIGLSNDKTFQKCGLNENKLIEYFNDNFDLINKFLLKVSKISNADVIILGNYCFGYSKNVNEAIKKNIDSLAEKAHFINLYEDIHDKSHFIPNKNSLYPSIEGYDFIYRKIIDKYNFSEKA